jgi:Protein of unknown function (DUF2752)
MNSSSHDLSQTENGRLFPPVDRRARLRAGGLMIVGVMVTLALAYRHPGGWVPECPTHQYLGFYCPGCGSLRATHHLLNLHFADAWTHNKALIVIGVPLALWFWLEQVLIVVIGVRLPRLFRSSRIAWTLLILLLIYTVARNLPGDMFDMLRPPEVGVAGTE